MAAYAALVCLVNNIEQIQRHTRLPIRIDQNQSEALLEKINFLIDFLEKYNYHGAGVEIKDLESRMRDVAEDIIETHVVDYTRAHSKEILLRKQNKKKSVTLQGIEKVMADMDFIKEEAMKLKDKNETRDLHPTIEPSISSVPAGKNTIVGFDDELTRIMKWLVARHSSRQVIPIVGMGGIGKTTLAKTVYDKPFIDKHFDFCAWVTISQEYGLKRILLGLLPDESSQMSDNELGQLLYQKLCGRRYLIVLDDMWSVDAWEMVMRFLPDDSNGSRIIITTRESSVSTSFGSSNLEMSFLSEDQSWSLFCEKVFPAKGCPSELEEVGRKIVKNCKGLPLSIIVIGGLLARSGRGKEYWEYIARDTIMNLADDEQCMKILYLSYQNLPVHLKPCFLYISAYSEDETIQASMLINLWIAEGFLKSKCSKELEVIGEEYLNDLISRNLIMVDSRGLNGKIKSCMIHDLLRDICLKEAKNDKFMYARKLFEHDDVQYAISQRRASFHKSISNETIIHQVFDTLKMSESINRSLIYDVDFDDDFDDELNYNSMDYPERSEVPKYSLNDIFELVNSRFITIKVKGNDPNPFPSSLLLFWNLQILIVKGLQEGSIIAPLEIWEMTELRHLEFRWGTCLPDPPPNQQMNTQEGDAAMKNLHTLKGTIEDFKLSDEVVKRIPNIKKLGISYQNLTGKELEDGLKNLGRLEKLESLNLSFTQETSSGIISYLTFPHSLKKLSLHGCRLQWEDMSMIASIPHLEVLKLDRNSFVGPNWILDEEIFPCLKALHIDHCNDLVQWIADDTHFPCLEYLNLRWLEKLVEIPSAIGDIPTLQKIELNYCSDSAVISAEKIQEEQEELGNMGLRVI